MKAQTSPDTKNSLRQVTTVEALQNKTLEEHSVDCKLVQTQPHVCTNFYVRADNKRQKEQIFEMEQNKNKFSTKLTEQCMEKGYTTERATRDIGVMGGCNRFVGWEFLYTF
eukprot:4130368-Amphidinium_carterae.2